MSNGQEHVEGTLAVHTLGYGVYLGMHASNPERRMEMVLPPDEAESLAQHLYAQARQARTNLDANG